MVFSVASINVMHVFLKFHVVSPGWPVFVGRCLQQVCSWEEQRAGEPVVTKGVAETWPFSQIEMGVEPKIGVFTQKSSHF